MIYKIRKMRVERGLQQHKIGHILDLPQSRISDIERGKRRVSLDEAVKIAKYFGVKVDDLIEEKT